MDASATRTPVIRRRECADAGTWPEDMPPLLRRIHAARGSTCIEQARPRLEHLPSPSLLGGMAQASALLSTAIAQDRHIVVVGDFDCDGATACALAVRGLRLMGARRVSPAVPNRMVHGYGLSPALVGELAALAPELLVTVDHGIACHAGIAAAKALGWQVLVTDHHLPGDALPPADAIVNPNLRGDPFPCKALAGVGVMFYVLLGLRGVLREQGHPGGAADLSSLLDLVAIGTVADLVPLDTSNRALVAAGLRRIRAGRSSHGVQALIEVAGRTAATLTAADIGFAVAPRINAAGRIEDMALGIECLLSDDPAQAREMATALDRINAERRALQQDMVDDADAAITGMAFEADPPAAVCLHDPDWHPGIVGLVASKMKDRLHRPVIAFAPTEPGGAQLRGSARSVPGLHIRDALAAVDVAHPGLVERFGGHAMAAGLSLPLESLAPFRDAFVAQVETMLDPSLLRAEHWSDGELMDDEFDRRHAALLRDAQPWGQGYPEPQFDGVFEVVSWRVRGERHLELELATGSRRLRAMHFGGWKGRAPARQVEVVYRLALDDWNLRQSFQLLISHINAIDRTIHQ